LSPKSQTSGPEGLNLLEGSIPKNRAEVSELRHVFNVRSKVVPSQMERANRLSASHLR
jgi:hypothetical protein